MKLLIRSARVLDPASGFDETADILCEEGRVAAIGKDIPLPEGCESLDANGLVASPGLVDMHCHLRDPGFEYKEDIQSGTRSAAAGGITSVACMPNTKPVCDHPDTVRYILEKALRLSPIRVFPIGAVTVGEKGSELTDFAALQKAGVVTFSDDGMPVTDSGVMRQAMQCADELGTVVISHCEDFSFSEQTAGTAESYGLIGCDVPIETDEEAMAARDLSLALQTNAPVHIAHISTKNTVDLIRFAKAAGARVTCETCPHYFLLTSEAVAEKGTLAKMNPPLRTQIDRDAILEGLCDGTIDAIATDHAPHSAEEKALPFTAAPNGIVGFETLLAGSLTALCHSGRMSLNEALRLLTCSPADILGIDAGRLIPGARADLVLFAPDEVWVAEPQKFLSKSKNSPFGGMELKGRVKYTLSAGKIVYSDTTLLR